MALRGRVKAVLLCTVVLCSGCGAIIRPGSLSNESAQLRILPINHMPQRQRNLCGPTAVCMVMRYWGSDANVAAIAEGVHFDPGKGVTLGDLKAYFVGQGYDAFLVQGGIDEVIAQIEKGRPALVCTHRFPRQNHLQVVIGYDPQSRALVVDDPGAGPQIVKPEKFRHRQQRYSNVFVVVAPTSKPASRPDHTGREE
jgi:ABC-type bacteriocin/lantibiotic exporter with double-glycine peptidase domain